MYNHFNQVVSTEFASLPTPWESIWVCSYEGIYGSNCNLILPSYLGGFRIENDCKNRIPAVTWLSFRAVFARCTWVSCNNAERACAGKDSLHS